MEEINKLLNESASQIKDCNLCKESSLKVGESSGYGVIVCKVGNKKNGWFATLSPKTGGDANVDFTIQLMPFIHLTHFSQIRKYKGLSENYGIIFSKVSFAMTKIMMQDMQLKSNSGSREMGASIATYGKSTTWKEKKEHLHIKIFPFRGAIGQPYTVDSTFEKKEVHKYKDGQFVKMMPVKKVMIDKKRFEKLSKELIDLIK